MSFSLLHRHRWHYFYFFLPEFATLYCVIFLCVCRLLSIFFKRVCVTSLSGSVVFSSIPYRSVYASAFLPRQVLGKQAVHLLICCSQTEACVHSHFLSFFLLFQRVPVQGYQLQQFCAADWQSPAAAALRQDNQKIDRAVCVWL